MSTETPDLSILEEEETGPNTATVGMGGTNDEDRAGDETESSASEQDESRETHESTQKPAAEKPSADGEVERLQRELEETKKLVANFDPIAEAILSDPQRQRLVEGWLNGSRTVKGEEKPGDPVDTSLTAIDEWFAKSPTERDALREIVTPLVSEIRRLNGEIEAMQPRLSAVSRSVSSGEFSRKLLDEGISPEMQRSKDFTRFRHQQEQDPDYRRDLKTRPVYAARVLANAWKAQKAQRFVATAKREQVDRVRDGQLNGSSMSAAGTEKVTVLDENDPERFSKALAIRMDAMKKGLPEPKITYRKSKS